MQLFREIGAGDYETKQVGAGMFLARKGNILCEVVLHGAATCTGHLAGDVWLFGDQIRSYDSERAPFEVHLYGFARDDVAAVRVTTADGQTRSLPVQHNAFYTTFSDTTFADINAIEAVDTSGRSTPIDPRTYFPSPHGRP